MAGAGLMPALLGGQWQTLEPAVLAVHGGGSRRLGGTATVERGRSIMARLMCAVASLPRDQVEGPVMVAIEASADSERWTRRFGRSAPMRSTLCAREGLLVERLGPVTLRFALVARDGGIDWDLKGVAVLGCPLPLKLFQVVSRSGASGGRYRFEVRAALAGVGPVIRYQGELDCESL